MNDWTDPARRDPRAIATAAETVQPAGRPRQFRALHSPPGFYLSVLPAVGLLRWWNW